MNTNLNDFIDHIRELISVQSEFARDGFTNQRIYRQYLSQVENPEYPCITLFYALTHSDFQLRVYEGKLYITIHHKTSVKYPADVGEWVGSLFLLYSADDAVRGITIHRVNLVSIPPTPTFNEKMNNWELMIECDFRVA
jgi:hypothetical protein